MKYQNLLKSIILGAALLMSVSAAEDNSDGEPGEQHHLAKGGAGWGDGAASDLRRGPAPEWGGVGRSARDFGRGGRGIPAAPAFWGDDAVPPPHASRGGPRAGTGVPAHWGTGTSDAAAVAASPRRVAAPVSSAVVLQRDLGAAYRGFAIVSVLDYTRERITEGGTHN